MNIKIPQTEARINNFAEDKEWAEKQEPFWQAFYKVAFPTMVNMMSCPGDFESQRRGVDRVILLQNGRIISVEEKARKPRYAEDGKYISPHDILLEYEHVYSSGIKRPGWIEKDLVVDYFSYGFILERFGYLFDWYVLKLTWTRFGSKWKNGKQYPVIPSQNKGYVTYNVAIPFDDLLGAISSTRTIRLEQGDVGEQNHS